MVKMKIGDLKRNTPQKKSPWDFDTSMVSKSKVNRHQNCNIGKTLWIC